MTLQHATELQDLYKRLQGPRALAGLLRVRCCPELRIKSSYGRLFPDIDHEQLYHLVSCDTKETLAFDLDFTTQNGFLSEGGSKVRLEASDFWYFDTLILKIVCFYNRNAMFRLHQKHCSRISMLAVQLHSQCQESWQWMMLRRLTKKCGHLIQTSVLVFAESSVWSPLRYFIALALRPEFVCVIVCLLICIYLY